MHHLLCRGYPGPRVCRSQSWHGPEEGIGEARIAHLDAAQQQMVHSTQLTREKAPASEGSLSEAPGEVSPRAGASAGEGPEELCGQTEARDLQASPPLPKAVCPVPPVSTGLPGPGQTSQSSAEPQTSQGSEES